MISRFKFINLFINKFTCKSFTSFNSLQAASFTKFYFLNNLNFNHNQTSLISNISNNELLITDNTLPLPIAEFNKKTKVALKKRVKRKTGRDIKLRHRHK